MRPDGTVVVREWIVTSLPRSDSADPPATEGIRAQQRFCDQPSPVRTGDSSVQAVPSIRCSHSAPLFVPIERQRVGRQIVAPKSLFKVYAKFFCLRLEGAAFLFVTQHFAQSGRCQFGGVHVTLHLA